MRLNFADYGYTLDDEKAVVNGSFIFDPSIPVSKNSCFGDSEWNYLVTSNKRLKILNPSSLVFNWGKITAATDQNRQGKSYANQAFLPTLPQAMVEELRRIFFIISMFPYPLARCQTKRGIKPNTLVAHIRQAVNFFGYICKKRTLKNGLCPLQLLQDVTLADIKSALDTYPYSTRCLKRVLLMISHELTQKNLTNGPLKWHRVDLKTIRWPAIKENEPIEPLPEALFALLSNKSTALVQGFLTLLGLKPSRQFPSDHIDGQQWSNFPAMFEDYVKRRQLTKKRVGLESNHTKVFKKKFGVEPRQIHNYLRDVQCAAHNVIFLYTGMRYSEAASIEKDCLISREGIPLIKSTLVKKKPTNLPVDTDEWVAADCVVNAVEALEQLSQCTMNDFLVSSFNIVKKRPLAPMSLGGLVHRLNEFLRAFDSEKEWTGWSLSTYQYRHGLVNQLARAEVGLPYITMQLKHVHRNLRQNPNSINEVTIIYGQQRERLLNNATGVNALKNARIEVIKDLYGEGRKFAGGGAALHVNKTEAFFKGMGIQGIERERYLEQLAESNVVLVRTGVGWCTRNHVDPQKLKEAPPPCIGDLNCNPHTCKHSVVPEGRKADVIEQYLHAKKKANEPNQAYLRSFWEASRDSFGAMLSSLGVNPESLTENYV